MERNPVAVEGSKLCWQANVALRLQPGHGQMNVLGPRKELPVLLPDVAEEICNRRAPTELSMKHQFANVELDEESTRSNKPLPALMRKSWLDSNAISPA